MARLSRFFLPGQPLHVIHRGKGGKRVFFRQRDYARYRDWLAEAAAHYDCAIHAYVLMPNHFYLLLEVMALPAARIMQSLLTGREKIDNRDPRRSCHDAHRVPVRKPARLVPVMRKERVHAHFVLRRILVNIELPVL